MILLGVMCLTDRAGVYAAKITLEGKG